jgi:hypothetical protein
MREMNNQLEKLEKELTPEEFEKRRKEIIASKILKYFSFKSYFVLCIRK